MFSPTPGGDFCAAQPTPLYERLRAGLVRPEDFLLGVSLSLQDFHAVNLSKAAGEVQWPALTTEA
jgi:hypothetical protein